MKVKSNLVLRQIVDTWMVIPVATEEPTEFLLKLNNSGAKLWNLLQEDRDIDDLANALVEEYNISFEVAKQDAQEFVDILSQKGCLE